MKQVLRPLARGGDITYNNVLRGTIFLLGGYAGYLIFAVHLFTVNTDPDHILGADFVSFWTSAHAAVAGNPLLPYDLASLSALEEQIFGVRNIAFFYPPIWLLYVLPFGHLPYTVAFWIFEISSLIAVCVAVAILIRRPRQAWMVLAFPGFLFCLIHGQNGMLTAALFAAAMASLDRDRPWLAGLFIGLMTYKPQFGILIPFCLLAARQYRAFAGAALTTLALAALSTAVFGIEVWQAFLAQMPLASEVLTKGRVDVVRMASLFTWLRQMDVPIELAMAIHFTAAAAVFVAVVWSWRRPIPLPVKAAMLTCGVCLVTPFVLDYDLAILAIPAALIIRMGLEDGFLDYEISTLALVFVVMFIGAGLGMSMPFSTGPLPSWLLFALACRRAFAPVPATPTVPA